MTRAILAVALVMQAGAAMADAAAGRIVDTLLRSDRYFYPDKRPAHVTLEGCQLIIEDAGDPEVFGSINRVFLADLQVTPPAFIYEMSDDIWRITLSTSGAAEAAQAPAFWRYMGGTDANRPDTAEIIAQASEWDPLGLGSWSDPSYITRWQQALYDEAWKRALEGEGGAALARSHSEWFGPAKGDWRPVWRNPGAYLQIGMPPHEVEPFLATLRDYVARTCP